MAQQQVRLAEQEIVALETYLTRSRQTEASHQSLRAMHAELQEPGPES